MATKSHPMSITLPRSFIFSHAADDLNIPRTPAQTVPTSDSDIPQPPVIARPGFKIRRRKRPDNIESEQTRSSELPEDSSAHAMPTIEMTEASDNSSPVLASSIFSDAAHLAPLPQAPAVVSSPRTPSSQAIAPHDKLTDEWALINRDLPMRPISACSNSNFSESSMSSVASSSQTFPSLAGSCTSPDSEPPDPFIDPGPSTGKTTTWDASSPTIIKRRRNAHGSASRWAAELDQHLWLTYLQYVQDPTVTPFKMLPGVVPPLGVCHRVARQAKRTWTRRSKIIEPASVETRAKSAAPSNWPGSESATRRRLRDLCRRQPSLSAHYQRLLKARSPSPFNSSSPPGRESSSGPLHPPELRSDAMTADPLVTPMATKTDEVVDQTDARPDASSATADQSHAGPFGSFALHEPMPPAPSMRPTDWAFRAGGRSRAHQKSQSLQLELGLGLPIPPVPAGQASGDSVLASPFTFHGDTNATRSLGRSFARGSAVPILRSPFDLPAQRASRAEPTRPRKRALKDEDDTSDSLNNVFVRASVPTSTPRAVPPPRDRALSLGAVHADVREIVSSFAHEPIPPMPQLPTIFSDEAMRDAQEPQQERSAGLGNPVASGRLGSPFGGGPGRSPGSNFNTFPRRFTPRASAGAVEGAVTPQKQRDIQ